MAAEEKNKSKGLGEKIKSGKEKRSKITIT